MRICWRLGLTGKSIKPQFSANTHDTDFLISWIESRRFEWEFVHDEKGVTLLKEKKPGNAWFVWKMEIEKE